MKIANVRKKELALSLPEGCLAINMGFWIECSFSADEVLDAAAVLIQASDSSDLTSQAEVIARAGKHGWGQGDVYRTF